MSSLSVHYTEGLQQQLIRDLHLEVHSFTNFNLIIEYYEELRTASRQRMV